MAISDLPEGELTAAASVPAEGANEAKARRVSVTKLAAVLHGLVQSEASPEPAGLHVGVSDGFAEERAGAAAGQDVVVMLHPMAAAVSVPPVTPALTWAAPDTATAGVAITGTITASSAASGPWSLNVPSGWTVSPSSGSSVAPGSPVSVSITGTEGTQSLTLTCSGATITGNPQSIVVGAAGAGLTVGAQITTLAVTNVSGSGSRPYVATVLLRPGQVPTGSKITNAAGTEVAAIGATYPDGSAAWAVLAGAASADSTVAVHVATGTAPANLTAAAVAAAGLTSVAVAFGSPYGTATITDFSTPERVWWATPTMICARYRVAAPTPGSTALEAVIDVHAWADRARVRVTVENAKVNTALSSVTMPAAASYTGAVVSVNGSTVATVNGNGAPEGVHSGMRAWTALAWVGAGDPGLRVTQSHADLQQHPLLFKMATASSADLSGYASDAYTPWATGRHRASNMGAGGDHDSIGPLPMWEARALQSGDYRAWNATEVSALAILGFGINLRDSATGLVPTIAQAAGKTMQNGSWPGIAYDNSAMGWEVAHSPAVGLMAFLACPDPVYIELAQKVALWNGTWSTYTDGGPAKATGVFVAAYQMRAWAWGLRSLAHATFLTPDGMAWKGAGQDSLAANVAYFDEWRTDSKQTALAVMWVNRIGQPLSINSSITARVNTKLWQYHWFIAEVAKIAASRVMKTANQAAADTLADWLCLHPVKWINDQSTTGAWRYVPEMLVLGTAIQTAPSMTNAADYATQRATWMTDSPPSTVAGPWKSPTLDSADNYATPWVDDTAGGVSRASSFWTALVAAVDRQVTGASAAWSLVQASVTNLSTWLTGFGTDPRSGCTPKNIFFATGTTAPALVGNTWTPGRESSGAKVNQASFDLMSKNRWYTIAGTAPSNTRALIEAVIPAWGSYAPNLYWPDWWGSWSSLAPLPDGSKCWYMGGGHSNGSNNSIIRFDFDLMKWAVAAMPSDPAAWSAAYKAAAPSGSTNYPESVTAQQAKQTAGTLVALNDVSADQTEDTPPKPTARHTYQGLVVIPEKNWLLVMRQRMWRLDLTTGAWVQRRRLFDEVARGAAGDSGGAGANYLDAENVISVYDSATGDLITSSQGSTYGGNGRAVKYNVNTETWTGGSSTGYDSPWQRNAQFVVTRGRERWFFAMPVSNVPGGATGHDGWSGKLNLDTGVFTQTAAEPASGAGFQYGGGLSRASFRKLDSYYDGQGGVYVPPIDKVWATQWNSAAVNTMYEIDIATWPPTISLAPTTGTPPTLQNYSKTKGVFVAPINAVVWFGGGDTDGSIYCF